MNAITIQVFAISPILPSPPEAWVRRTKPQSANRAPNAREDPADPAEDGRLAADPLREPAEEDAPVVGIENVQEVRAGSVGWREAQLDPPSASAVVHILIPE